MVLALRCAGLEVRVAFGAVWKESLTELSGGQRSLLALSLILALCRWGPGVRGWCGCLLAPSAHVTSSERTSMLAPTTRQ